MIFLLSLSFVLCFLKKDINILLALKLKKQLLGILGSKLLSQ